MTLAVARSEAVDFVAKREEIPPVKGETYKAVKAQERGRHSERAHQFAECPLVPEMAAVLALRQVPAKTVTF